MFSIYSSIQWPTRGFEPHKAALTQRMLQKYADLALAGNADITVRIVGNAEASMLNQQYRGKAYATNVLTFDYSQTPVVHADLVLCAPVVQREAKALGITLKAHYAHLVVHGLLHAQGYDHETSEADADEMESLEVLMLGALGFANPYAAP
jgi:probable rRNA maturation factor